MDELTADQAAEVDRLVSEGVPRDQAIALATEVRLDVVIDGSGPLGDVPPLLEGGNTGATRPT